MLKLTCPICSLEADETEFHAGGEAHVVRPASSTPDEVSDEAFRDYLFIHENPRGISHELWLCARGCGKWFHAARDTYSQDIKRVYRVSEPKNPPPKPLAASAVKTSAKKAAAKRGTARKAAST